MLKLHLALLGVLVALAVALALRGTASSPPAQRPSPESDSSALLLPDAALLATLDVRELRRSVWGRATLDRIAELHSVQGEQSCARRELEAVDRIHLAVRVELAAEAAPSLAIVADGKLGADGVLRCARALTLSRQGDPVVSRLGSFATLRNRRGEGELAVRDGGPLILSGGSYFRELVDRAQGLVPTEASLLQQLHRALHQQTRDAPLRLSWVLQPGWLEQWLGDAELGASALGDVRAVSASAQLAERLRVRAVFTTASVDSTPRVEQTLRDLLEPLTRGLELELGPGQVEHTISRDKERVRLQLSAPILALASKLEALSAAP